jgi:hypothetical protein
MGLFTCKRQVNFIALHMRVSNCTIATNKTASVNEYRFPGDATGIFEQVVDQ